MRSKILSFLLVCVFLLGSVCLTALAADGSGAEATPEDAAQDMAEPTPEPTQVVPMPVVPLPLDGVPEPSSSQTEESTTTPDPTETPEATEAAPPHINIQITGSGTLQALRGGAWERVEAGMFELTSSSTDFRAVANGANQLVSVTFDGSELPFTQDASQQNAWRFTVSEPVVGARLSLTFSDQIAMSLAVEGPGTVSQQVTQDGTTTWQPLAPGAGAASIPVSQSLTLAASATEEGYACTSIKVNGVEVAPAMLSAQGAQFKAEPKDGVCEVAVEFTRSDQLVMDLGGEGKAYLVKGSDWIELADEARLPFVADRDAPMRFVFAPAAGYSMGTVTFQGGALNVTEEQESQNSYTATLVSPVNGGVLKATFLADDDSLIEWIRGTDTTTGISWAVPLGTSVYGTSNVTAGSRIHITRLTQGSAYEAARTAATPYSQFAAWDISLVDANGHVYTPNVPVLMNLPIPSGFPTTIPPLRMLHILANGQVVQNTIETRQNPQSGSTYLYMRAESLSTFVLVNTNSPASTASPSPGGTVQATNTPAGTPTSPRTGDSSNLELWWTMLVLSIAGIAVSGFELGRASAGR